MNTALIFGIVVASLLVIRFLLGTEYTIRNIATDQLEEHIRVLLYRGLDGSFCRITKKGRLPFVQVYKTIRSKGSVEIHLTIPLWGWAIEYLEDVKLLIGNFDLVFQVKKGSEPGLHEFLDIDFATDSETCSRLVDGIFKDAFSIDVNRAYKIRYSRISPHKVKIGF